LAAYETETKPVADYYRAQRRLVAVNADRPMEDVTAEIFGVIDSHCKDSHCQGGC
jgi:adenylate kinase family enzyme